MSVLAPGTYRVSISGGCQPAVETFTLLHPPAPSVSIAPQGLLGCPEDTVSLRFAANQTPLSFQWSEPGRNGVDSSFSTVYTPNSTVRLTVAFTCVSQEITYTFPPSPTFSATLNTDFREPLCQGDEVVFTTLLAPAGELLWWDGSTSPSRTLAIDSTVAYSVRAIGPCQDTVLLLPELDFSRCPLLCEIQFPELITPNGDGTNDRFRPYFACSPEAYKLSIFNRWGQEVFRSSRPDEGWDGQYQGQAQPMDTYLYRANFRFRNQTVAEQLDGSFSLLR
ncbi:MAG: gliding motility-associated C-terminal domain-containing protein [Lewinella sp.]|nr:gliding motility-associated C-terminal domain-containing protein [Lewinella sp.]